MIIKTRLNGKYQLQALNTLTICAITYSAAFLNWKKEETKELDCKTRRGVR